MDEDLGGKFVFVVSFLGIFIILVSTMPYQFYLTAPEYAQYSYPEFFTKEDIEYISFMRNVTLTAESCEDIDFTDDAIPEHGERGKVNFKFYCCWMPSLNRIFFKHYEWEWWIFARVHSMYCFNEPNRVEFLTKNHLIENWDSDYNASVIYPVSCNCIVTKVWFTDTNETRNNISQAWDEGAIHVIMGFGFDDYETSISSWALVGQLLTFQAPDIHPVINAIIAIPIWATIAYVAYILILKALPFVGA